MPTSKRSGTRRARPGTRGRGHYYRVDVRPRDRFVSFRYHDVGRKGHLQRLAGQRERGGWDDVTWLISKDDAHIERGKLVPDTTAARKLLQAIGPARHVEGDVFTGHPRRDVPEREKPTSAQRRARRRNIAKAQAARRRRTGSRRGSGTSSR